MKTLFFSHKLSSPLMFYKGNFKTYIFDSNSRDRATPYTPRSHRRGVAKVNIAKKCPIILNECVTTDLGEVYAI